LTPPRVVVDARLFDRMVTLRRDLHQHPELSFDEHHTMRRIARELDDLGVPHVTGVAGTGIVADLPGLAPGPRVALRADTDALPIQEHTGLPFASRVPGVMHACGHDGHSSSLVGAAALLMADPPPHPVRLLWQPGEEQGNGALRMIEAGVLEDVAMIFGGHLDRGYPPGTVVVTEGAVNASTDTFVVEVLGRQGHGARPHETIDAIVVASLVVTALQTVVTAPRRPRAGGGGDGGPVRRGERAPTSSPARRRSRARSAPSTPTCGAGSRSPWSRVARSVGSLHGAAVAFTMLDGTPPLVNPPEATGARPRGGAAGGPDGADALAEHGRRGLRLVPHADPRLLRPLRWPDSG
jgi:metal-dependent amidase/aminoacylase/carboxypeptidase family protein